MGSKVLVIGAGISGIGAVSLLAKAGKDVILYDGNDKLEQEQVRERLHGAACEIVLGTLTEEVLQQTEIAVISPGIDLETPFVEQIRTAGIPIWSEIELAYRYAKGRLIAITGTNGKTTTTALTGRIMKNWVGDAYTVGNIGTAYTSVALDTTPNSITTAEVSSFQLESIAEFHPQVSAILNITPDHLNRHHTMEEYTRVKELVTKNQTKDDTCVLNYEDARLRAFGEQLEIPVVWFSSKQKVTKGLYLKDDAIWYTADGAETEILPVAEQNLIGVHNYENIMAAVGIALAMGTPLDVIRKTLREFKAVEHRIEYVATKKGVRYYDDSKGTNVDAAIQAVKAMSTPTVLIGGGYDKGAEYDDWIKEFHGKIKLLVLMGQTREKIAETARKLGMNDICFVDSMEEAVQVCAKAALPGETVLLSPACASWGMFKNYEQRGDIFKELVRALAD